MWKQTQAVVFSWAVALIGVTGIPSAYGTPSATAGAFSVRKRCSTISRVFPMTAVAVATFRTASLPPAAAAPPQRVTHH